MPQRLSVMAEPKTRHRAAVSCFAHAQTGQNGVGSLS
jgi:hypothetical protein